MVKWLKSCTGVLLRANLTGHGHPTHFGRKGLNDCALLGQPSKGHPCRILIRFPWCSTTSLIPHIKKLETYFPLFILLDFRSVTGLYEGWGQVCQCISVPEKGGGGLLMQGNIAKVWISFLQVFWWTKSLNENTNTK